LVLHHYQSQRTLFGWWNKTYDNDSTQSTATVSDSVPSDQLPPTEPISSTTNFNAPITPAEPTGYIPEPPPIPMDELVLNAIGEPTLKSLGLGSSFTPPGWIQLFMETLHVDVGLSWFQSIVVFTVIMRTCLIPLSIAIQRNAAQMKIMMPKLQELTTKIQEAKIMNNYIEGKFKDFYRIVLSATLPWCINSDSAEM
jgi:hypothetical protein